MKKMTWKSYWESADKSFIERQIQLYKAKQGYGKLLQAVPEIGERGRVLEVGAGKAWISRLLRARGWRTIAIDLDSDIAMSNSKFVDSYVIGDMFNLPFKENSFDLVMSCGLLEHFNLDTVQKILAEMGKVGKSIVAWLPTCSLDWKALWTIRNILGGHVFAQSYIHRKKSLENIFVSIGLQNIRVGDVLFAGFLRYIYVYGNSISPSAEYSSFSRK